ncbi:MAG TPA: hypothetical protein VFU13_20140 [Steroidobacteraceae bacterium]|nr:hypothetical protein [Steroidobacteraceae bacterium]
MNAREKHASAGTVTLDVRDLHMRYGTRDVARFYAPFATAAVRQRIMAKGY